MLSIKLGTDRYPVLYVRKRRKKVYRYRVGTDRDESIQVKYNSSFYRTRPIHLFVYVRCLRRSVPIRTGKPLLYA